MRHVVLCSGFLLLATLVGCARPPAGRSEPPPAPVVVATAGKKTVPVRMRTIGSVKAVATVAIRPQVGGQLTEVYFQEGDYVKAGDKLFQIDPRPYDAAVKQAEANLAKSQTLLTGAELDLRRAEDAKRSGVGAATDYDAALTAAASAKAVVEADRVALRSAKIQAEFTTIASPIDGRVGELLVPRGNLVEANGTNPLVVINQIRPISVTFTLPEQQLPIVVEARKLMEARKRGPLKVEVDLRGGGKLADGVLSFIDNAADSLTGTVLFKAEFPNPEERLWPGLFVDVILTLGERTDSVVIPSAALQSGQKGQYVYVVTPEKKAELRTVTVAFESDGEAVIASGLSGGETVVVEGQLRLAPGVKVEPKPLPTGSGAPVRPTAAPRVVAEGAQ
jgi:membrane fusion protein, multidrug efflux system